MLSKAKALKDQNDSIYDAQKAAEAIIDKGLAEGIRNFDLKLFGKDLNYSSSAILIANLKKIYEDGGWVVKDHHDQRDGSWFSFS
jgi:hypothetical protein